MHAGLLRMKPAPCPESILARSKAASGGEVWDRVQAVRMEGEIALGGLSGPVEHLLMPGRGASLQHFKLGPIEQWQGFDGKAAWSRDAGGVTPQDSEAARQSAATDAYVDARAYWYPQRWAAKVEFAGTRSEDGSDYLVLKILPEGGQAVDLWIDAATHRVDRVVKGTGGAERSRRWLDYRSVDGALFPFRQQAWKGGDRQHEVLMRFSRILANEGVQAGDFVMPAQQLDDFAFLDGAAKAVIPFRLANNHIYIAAQIKGHALQLMLDTGGANILTPEAAARIGIESCGALKVEGPGQDAAAAGLASIDTITIGNRVSMSRQAFRIVPLPGFEEVEGLAFDGLLGFEVFRRFVVRVDYARRELVFEKPSEFCAANAGTALPLRFFRTTPMVDGSLDGLPAQFEIDTGSRAALTLWAPFVNAHDLIARYGAVGETTIGWGVGGKASGYVARGGGLQLSSFSLQGPVLTMVTETTGASSRPKVDGNIGGEILRRFVVSFDYAQQRLYLLPNRDFAGAFDYDRSGMWINGRPDGFEVKSLMRDGPAERAGLKAGDLIVAVDGVPAASLSLAGLRRNLQVLPAGSRLRLAIAGAGMERSIELVLRDLIRGMPA